jgi:hypothetical protein
MTRPQYKLDHSLQQRNLGRALYTFTAETASLPIDRALISAGNRSQTHAIAETFSPFHRFLLVAGGTDAADYTHITCDSTKC